MVYRCLVALLLAASASGCAQDIGSSCDGCDEDFELPTAVAENIPVATCSQTGTLIQCEWAHEESLVRAPLNNLQASLSVWVKSDEGIPATSNQGGIVTYDLAGSSWEPGKRVLFRTTVAADWSGSMEEIRSDDLVAYPEDLAGGFEVSSPLQVWDIGLIAADRNVVSDFEFEGAMSFVREDMLLEKRATVLRLVVDPSAGVELYSNGSPTAHLDRAGYYRFTDPYTVEFDSQRSGQ